ncbi:MAG: serine/threonine-protein kinase [Polyangiales bacterium]
MPAPKIATRFADRFDIERLAGSGGMGEVFRAWDASTQSVVALKVVRPDDGASASESEGGNVAQRFLREAEVLAQLSHPAIVRHVGHGITDDGRLWLAMEWLDGEDLQKRLARQGLSVREALSLIERLADALGAVHARGVVHRDIKPSNVFLAGGDVSRPKLLDFGIARLGHGARAVTQTGVVIGTPGYMSPEQARGERIVDARSDVFALGCVAFEALVGRPVFVGSHALAILAKIVLEEVPSVRSIRGDLPPSVDELIARMLEKDPARRFRDGAHVAEALRSIGALSSSIPAPSRAAPGSSQAITDGEQRLVSVVAARGGEIDSPVSPLGATLPALRPRAGFESVVALREAVKPFGARLEVLQDGTVVATLGSRAAATDQATSAARAAIALKNVLGAGARIAVATGRGVVGVEWAVGEVIDRVAQLLRASDSPGIVLDEVTSGLLDPRFELSPVSAEISELRGEAREVDATRPLLGKPTPCVGRERELATLEAAVAACVEDGVAHAVVITAAAGVGKSRLRHELARRVMARGDEVEIWTARGDPLRAGSAFALLGGAVRVAAGILEGEPLEIRRDKLRARIGRHVKTDLDRVVTFVGEAIGIPFDQGDSLRAAKADAVLLGDQIRRAFEDWIDAETKAHPLLIVLEDLHHGDLPTVRVIDAVLRNSAERPLLVLALGRPELDATFGELFRDRPRTELRLGELPKRACERIVRHALGDVDAAVVERIVAESAGNALYLEELVRARAAGEQDLPATLLAMVQARLERLEPEARRVLRAASVFGHAFWRAGVRALLADDTIDPWIDALIERESFVPRTTGRFAGEEEIAFRHAVVREAAYGMLTDEDRMLGHRLAAEWLARAGENDALVLAEHWERGGEPLRAIEQYRRAAEQALGGTDLAAAIARAERGIACGADGILLGALRAIQAEAHKWRGEFREAESAGKEAMRALPPRTAPWYAALCEVVAAVDRQGKSDELLGLAAFLHEEPVDAEAHAIASVRVAVHLTGAGRYVEADGLLQSFSRAVEGRADPLIAARVYQARAMRARLEGKPDRARGYDEAAAEAFDAIGDARRATNHRLSASYGDLQLGDWARATAGLTRGLATAERLGLVGLAASAKHNLGLALARQRRFEEARGYEERAIATFAAHVDPRMEGASRMYLAEIILEEAETAEARDALLDRAEKEASRAIALLEVAPPLRAQALAVKARVLLARGDRAIEVARAAIDASSSSDAVDDGDALVRLTFAEALDAAGETALARAAIEEARTRLLSRAARLEDDATRAAFLRNVPEHARTLALWERWSHRAPTNRL